jgi:hypothetical protein
MHAIHFSPHTMQISENIAERAGLILVGVVSVVTVAGLVFAAVGWYLWNFS